MQMSLVLSGSRGGFGLICVLRQTENSAALVLERLACANPVQINLKHKTAMVRGQI